MTKNMTNEDLLLIIKERLDHPSKEKILKTEKIENSLYLEILTICNNSARKAMQRLSFEAAIAENRCHIVKKLRIISSYCEEFTNSRNEKLDSLKNIRLEFGGIGTHNTPAPINFTLANNKSEKVVKWLAGRLVKNLIKTAFTTDMENAIVKINDAANMLELAQAIYYNDAVKARKQEFESIMLRDKIPADIKKWLQEEFC